MWTGGSVPLLAQQGRRPAAARGYSYVHLDVFTDRKLAGNPLLAYLNPEGLDAETRLAGAASVAIVQATHDTVNIQQFRHRSVCQGR